jgi:hypothetical protein
MRTRAGTATRVPLMQAMHEGSHERESDATQPARAGWHGPSEPAHEHSREDRGKYPKSEKKCKKYQLQGDFLLHCHVEIHVMEGIAAVLRAT